MIQISSDITQGVTLPIWLVSLSCCSFVGLFAIIGWFFKTLVDNITGALKELTTAFNTFKDDAPKKFVTQSYFELASRQTKEDIDDTKGRIIEFAKRFDSELASHKKECPGAVIRRNHSESR